MLAVHQGEHSGSVSNHKMGLEDKGITVGTPFFVRYCRVNTARTIGPLLDAEVTCVLIGGAPGSSDIGEHVGIYCLPCETGHA